ncbi:right-handed parallel beta-helix repeat-containing protein [bacterium]|nr:right-handed parallel beta-helix repeat-containing protein [bacterium]
MTRARTLALAVLLTFALLFTTAIAQDISGSLSGTLGPGTYNVVGNCQVDAGQSLTIEPGTTFLFTGHYALKVFGTLHAVGTEADSIVFKRQQATSTCEWSGIRFMVGCSPNSILSYARLEWAKYHTYPDYNGGAVYIEEDGITISHCYIKNNYASSGGGMYINNVMSATITDCIFLANEAGNGGGMYINNSQYVTVDNSIIAKNKSTST